MSKTIKVNFEIYDDMTVNTSVENYKILQQCLNEEDWQKLDNLTQEYLLKIDNLANLKNKKITSGKLEVKLEKLGDKEFEKYNKMNMGEFYKNGSISLGTYNSLRAANINTFGKLIETGSKKVSKLERIGKVSKKELEGAVRDIASTKYLKKYFGN